MIQVLIRGICMVLLHPRVVTKCCEQLENKGFTSIQIYSDVPHTREGMTKTTHTSTVGTGEDDGPPGGICPRS